MNAIIVAIVQDLLMLGVLVRILRLDSKLVLLVFYYYYYGYYYYCSL